MGTPGSELRTYLQGELKRAETRSKTLAKSSPMGDTILRFGPTLTDRMFFKDSDTEICNMITKLHELRHRSSQALPAPKAINHRLVRLDRATPRQAGALLGYLTCDQQQQQQQQQQQRWLVHVIPTTVVTDGVKSSAPPFLDEMTDVELLPMTVKEDKDNEERLSLMNLSARICADPEPTVDLEEILDFGVAMKALKAYYSGDTNPDPFLEEDQSTLCATYDGQAEQADVLRERKLQGVSKGRVFYQQQPASLTREHTPYDVGLITDRILRNKKYLTPKQLTAVHDTGMLTSDADDDGSLDSGDDDSDSSVHSLTLDLLTGCEWPRPSAA